MDRTSQAPNPNDPPFAQAAEEAEALQARGEPDSFPPEGTDEKIVQPPNTQTRPFSEAEALAATRAAIAREHAAAPVDEISQGPTQQDAKRPVG